MFVDLHPVPQTNPKKLSGRLSYLYVFVRLEIAQNRQNLLEIREVAKKLPSNLWKGVPDSENRPSLRPLLYFLVRTIALDCIVHISSKGTNTNPKFLYLIATDVSH